MKKMTTYLVGTAFFISMAATVYGAAVKAKCTVKAVKENNVILDCGKKSDKMKVGDLVKVRVKDKRPIEGC